MSSPRAETLSIARSVLQAEAEALRKLRHPSRAKKLKDFLD